MPEITRITHPRNEMIDVPAGRDMPPAIEASSSLNLQQTARESSERTALRSKEKLGHIATLTDQLPVYWKLLDHAQPRELHQRLDDGKLRLETSGYAGLKVDRTIQETVGIEALKQFVPDSLQAPERLLEEQSYRASHQRAPARRAPSVCELPHPLTDRHEPCKQGRLVAGRLNERTPGPEWRRLAPIDLDEPLCNVFNRQFQTAVLGRRALDAQVREHADKCVLVGRDEGPLVEDTLQIAEELKLGLRPRRHLRDQ